MSSPEPGLAGGSHPGGGGQPVQQPFYVSSHQRQTQGRNELCVNIAFCFTVFVNLSVYMSTLVEQEMAASVNVR